MMIVFLTHFFIGGTVVPGAVDGLPLPALFGGRSCGEHLGVKDHVSVGRSGGISNLFSR